MLSIPKMLSGANNFEISDIQEVVSRGSPNKPECHNVTLRGKLATVSIRQRPQAVSVAAAAAGASSTCTIPSWNLMSA
jgi:hypothetical protein